MKKEGNAWLETDAHGTMFTFKEVSRTDGTTLILDDSRRCYLKWLNGGGQVEISIGVPMVWRDLYVVTLKQ